MKTSPRGTPLRLRLVGLLLGAGMFFWIPFEDSTSLFPTFFAIAIGIWMAVFFALRSGKFSPRSLIHMSLAGLLTGLAITPLTLLLMAVKTGLHAHQSPDFSPQQTLDVLYRTPVWLIGGLLVGLGFSLLQTRN